MMLFSLSRNEGDQRFAGGVGGFIRGGGTSLSALRRIFAISTI